MVNKQRRKKFHLAHVGFIGAMAFLCSFAVVQPSQALDYQFEQTIVGPVDVCPNIPGDQATMPSGMQHDGGGNCYTPTPPPEPPAPAPDLCNNLAGTQTTLPAGYYRTGGNCYAQPLPPADPVDVCPNIPEAQSVVPDGMYLDAQNTCLDLPPPKDVCTNIGGPQSEIPEDMKSDNGYCYTPPATGPGTTETPPSETVHLQNVPDFLAPVIKPLVDIIPEPLKQALRQVPEEVAKAVPYYIFFVFGLLVLIPMFQAIREAIYIRQLAIILKRERDIAEQKDNFMALASHYLRTPLTLMKSGLDTIVSLKELPAATLQPLTLTLTALDGRIDNILGDIEKNKTLQNISVPTVPDPPAVLRSGFFWGPVIGSIVLTIIANFLLGVVGDKNLGSMNLFFQTLVAVAFAVVLYTSVRNLYLKKRLHQQHDLLIIHEKTVDEARNRFIEQTTFALEEGLSGIDTTKSVVTAAPSAKFFEEGYARFRAILEKFLLLSQIRAGSERTFETFDLRESIDTALAKYQTAIEEKQVTIINNAVSTPVSQNRLLFDFVIGSLIDNAIKFNQEGGELTINAKPHDKVLTFAINDSGIGINDEKLGQLFKPFSRATSSIEFNYEGLGFSLFLDKIIMDYTGGSIFAQSTPDQGTSMTVNTPIAAASATS